MSVTEQEPAAQPADNRSRWLALAVLSGGVALIIIDATIVNVALPTIIPDLGLRLSTAEWVNTTYALVFASLLIVVGRLGDRRGRKRLFVTGIGVFVAASLLAGAAPTGGWLIAARVVQGVGGALMLPTSLAIVNATFRGRERGIAFAVWGSTIGGMAALGPLAGGWLTTNAGWRWIFLVNVPIGIGLAIAALRIVPESRDPDAEPAGDPVGVVTLVLGLGALVFSLIEGQTYGWLRPKGETFSVLGIDWPLHALSPIPFGFLLAVVLLAGFVLEEVRRGRAGRTRLVDLSLFSIGSFRYGNVAILVVSLGEFGLLFTIPLFLQNVLGYSAFDTGVILLSLAGGAFLAGGVAAPVSQRIGSRAVARAGLLLEAVGLFGYAVLIGPSVPGWQLTPALFVYGFGVGFATAQLTGVVLVDVPARRSGQASGVQSTARQVGSALGVAILGAALAIRVHGGTYDRLVALHLPAGRASAIATAVERSAGTALPGLRAGPGGAQLGPALDAAFAAASRDVALLAATFILCGLLATLALPRSHDDG